MLISFALLVLGFALLVWSADKFVYGAAALARNLGISTMIIGLTIVAMGSSAPEMMVSASASIADKTDTAVGNAIGSNITNILLVLGLTALLKPMSISSSTVYRELPIVLAVSVLAWWFIQDNYFSFNEGAALAIAFALFIGGLMIIAMRNRNSNQNKGTDLFLDEAEDEIPEGVSNKNAIFWVVLGIILLPLSSTILVDAATDIAKYFGMSDLVIGLTIIAIGTSLPELAASIAGVMKNEDDLAIGNIIGSNIFNILAVLSIAGLINPSAIDPSAGSRDALIMIGATLMLVLMSLRFRGRRRINRFEGAVMLSCFIGYQALIFLTLS
ncbi:calcium/sodium antiporter [Flocculibacter collagenilyticus]|uniref:calcium/sodium antiporter n=1 Tax=Flocculibacter collagenilyticus TaxID=2744479 RepID=UPI0018F5B7D1|nr:calcium/sodium antiporter [Flocculibacter collagenilyticus]